MTTIPVYVPTRAEWTDSGDVNPAASLIDQGSGIVGTPLADWLPDGDERTRLVLDYEGNRFNASNIVTFADRVYHAYGRHQAHYPTAARLWVPPEAVTRVATFHPEHGRVEITDGQGLYRIAEWIGMPLGSSAGDKALHDQLRCTSPTSVIADRHARV